MHKHMPGCNTCLVGSLLLHSAWPTELLCQRLLRVSAMQLHDDWLRCLRRVEPHGLAPVREQRTRVSAGHRWDPANASQHCSAPSQDHMRAHMLAILSTVVLAFSAQHCTQASDETLFCTQARAAALELLRADACSRANSW